MGGALSRGEDSSTSGGVRALLIKYFVSFMLLLMSGDGNTKIFSVCETPG